MWWRQKMVLECNPCLAKYSTFDGLNSTLHLASADGHDKIVTLLLESGADVTSRNYCGQTALMQACRYGHWKVVQTLLIFRCNVTSADYLSGRTALHFAAVNGHVRCIRLLLADFIPSAPLGCMNAQNADGGEGSNTKNSALSKFVNMPADGGITSLHMTALNGYFDCVQLLLDLQANVSAVTFQFSLWHINGSNWIWKYTFALCCLWGKFEMLSDGSQLMLQKCGGIIGLSLYLHQISSQQLLYFLLPVTCLPLMSVLNIARESGLQSCATSFEESDTCAVCLERACSVAAEASSIPSEMVNPLGSIRCPPLQTRDYLFPQAARF